MDPLLLDKAAGAVGCAHCQMLGARQACRICHQPVCEKCSDDVAGCPDPRPREFDVSGDGALDVDLKGRYFVRRVVWDKPPQLFELANGRPLPEEVPTTRIQFETQGLELLAYPDGSACIMPGLADGAHGDPRNAHYSAIRFARCKGGRLVTFTRADQRITILDCTTGAILRSVQEAGEVVQCTALDEASDLLVVGVYDGAAFFRISDGERLGRLQTGAGDTVWIGLAAGWVGLIGAGGGRLQVGRPAGIGMNYLRLDELALGQQPFRVRHGRDADLSPDGRLFAGATREGDVGVFDLQTQSLQRLSLANEGEGSGFFARLFDSGPHCDFVQFTDRGRRLVAASGERVVVWTWDGTRFFTD